MFNARRILGALAALALIAGCAQSPAPTPITPDPIEAPTPAATAEPTTPEQTPSPEPTSDPTPEPIPEALVATAVGQGFDAPWSVAFYGETPILSERDTGRVLELDPSGVGREMATIEQVNARGEGGLLGLAVLDEYLFAYLTTASDNRILRFPIEGMAGTLSLGDPAEILTGIPAASYHNGGRIGIGPDGMLYATTGDAGDTSTSQNLDSLAGKILRMTPDGDVPADNPFADSLVWSYGHRNPQGIGWGPDGTMYASEFGQNTWDELNVIEPGGNYGWPEAEGIAGGSDKAGDGGFIDPVQQWPTNEASPSGIAVTENAIYIANLRGERLRMVPLADLSDSREFFVGEFGRLRDVELTPGGGLWVLTNNTDGRGTPGADDDRILEVSPE